MDSASADLAAPAGAAGPSSDAPDEDSRGHGSWAGLLWMIPVAALVLAADQLTKLWAVESLGYQRTIDLFWTARFNLVRNEGAAFSLGSDFTPFIAVGAIAIAITVIVVSRRVQRRSVLIALGLVLGGALGNLVDRVAREGSGFLRGAVVDFIDFQWWPVFNVADIAIVVGGMLLVLLMSDEVVPGSHDRHRSD